MVAILAAIFIFHTNAGLSVPNFEQPGFMIGVDFYLNFLLNYLTNRNKLTTFHNDISCNSIKVCFNNNAAYNEISLDNTQTNAR